MANASRRKGSRFETDLVEFFRGLGYTAERLRQSGSNDEGDIYVTELDAVIEAKAPGPGTPISLPAWCAEAQVERENYAKRRKRQYWPTGLTIIKARNKSISDAFVVIPLHHFLTVYGENT